MNPLEQQLCTLAKKRLGYDVPEVRLRSEIMPKIEKLVGSAGYASVSMMLKKFATISDNHPHYLQFVDILTINETSFFRQVRQLTTIANQCKKLYTDLKRPIRIWCAACSSGEEAYSLLFLMHERSIPVEIIGTDINKPSLRFATAARNYPKYRARSMTPKQRKQFLVETETGYNVHPSFKDKIQFQYHNLIAHPPPKLRKFGNHKTWDIIVCRNVFIYFPQNEVTQVAQKMATSLEDTGELWLGVNDTLHDYQKFLQRHSLGGMKYFKKPSVQRSVVSAPRKPTSDWPKLKQAIQLEQWTEATALLVSISRSRTEPQAKVLCTQGVLAMRSHQFAQAERHLRKAHIHAPKESTIQYFLGVIAHKRKQTDEATRWMEAAVQNTQSFWPAHFLLGQYAHKANDSRKKLLHLQKAQQSLSKPLPEFFQAVFPELVESVHNNVGDVRTMIDFYLNG